MLPELPRFCDMLAQTIRDRLLPEYPHVTLENAPHGVVGMIRFQDNMGHLSLVNFFVYDDDAPNWHDGQRVLIYGYPPTTQHAITLTEADPEYIDKIVFALQDAVRRHNKVKDYIDASIREHRLKYRASPAK